MKKYYLNGFSNSKSYLKFVDFAIKNSDAFSLVYFKYNNSEIPEKTVEQVEKILCPFEIYSELVNEWASMKTLNEFNHIYNLKMYKAEEGAKEALVNADSLFEWDYPQLPMDLCFFKDGYAWVSSCAHEHHCEIYLENDAQFTQLQEMGADIEFAKILIKEERFFDPKAIVK